MSHPPKPRLTLRVGITGHRLNRLSPTAPQILRASIGQLLKDIRESLKTIHAQNQDCFSTEHPRLILVSALAEGADRIAAEVARELGLELYCPLPFARAEYEKDFADQDSRALYQRLLGEASVFELDGSRPDADQAYESAGLFVLRQSDLVIAVWNGQSGAGRGGTHDIVQSALAAGIPLLRFDENGAGPSILRPADSASAQDARDLVAAAPPARPDQVDGLIRTLVAPPAADAGTTARRRLGEYYAERERSTNNWIAYPLFLRLFAGRRGVWKLRRPAPYLAGTQTAWQTEFWGPIEGACSLDARYPNKRVTPANIAEVLQPRFAWADGLAVYHGQAYRSSYVLAFTLGAVAVFFAVLPLLINVLLSVWPGPEFAKKSRDLVELICSGFALLSILSVGALVWRGRQTRRHDRWLDYRILAERLRVIRVLALTGAPLPELRMPHRDEPLKAQQSWVTWYVRATSREIGIPLGSGDAHYAELAKCALLQAELRGQSGFHKAYNDRERKIGHRLESIGMLLFILSAAVTVVAVVYFGFMVTTSADHHKDPFSHLIGETLMFFAALFPATGAALFGLRSQGEFERNARLSEATHEQLEAIIKRVEANGSPSFGFIARAIDQTASVITSELSDWRFIFWGKPLTLPG